MSHWHLWLIGVAIGSVVFFLGFDSSGDAVRDISRFAGASMAGVGLAYLVARVRW